MADTTIALVIRLREFGDNSVSMVVLPNHFEISAEFTDNHEEGENPARLYMEINIHGVEEHDGDGSRDVIIPLFPGIVVPPEHFGEFVIEDAGDRVMAEMLDCISRDIAAHLMHDGEDKDPYFDITQYEPYWREQLDRSIGNELDKRGNKQPNTDKDK